MKRDAKRKKPHLFFSEEFLEILKFEEIVNWKNLIIFRKNC